MHALLALLRRLSSYISAMALTTPAVVLFPEEDLLSKNDGFFITYPGAILKDGRYKVIRKLGRGSRSNTFLVEDLQPRHVP